MFLGLLGGDISIEPSATSLPRIIATPLGPAYPTPSAISSRVGASSYFSK